MSESPPSLVVRRARDDDWGAIWPIFAAVVARGDTYAYPPDIAEPDARRLWLAPGAATYVAEADGAVVGTYVLKPNQPGLGDHVANAGYMVAADARGRGVGAAMCEHSLGEARAAGYRAMQFNFVVSTNERAVALWRRMGFAVVGTVPRAFRHREQGEVDVYVMHRFL
jgi:L-amino acid N-acyltransferase YncA